MSVTGGCINRAYRIADGEHAYSVKANTMAPLGSTRMPRKLAEL